MLRKTLFYMVKMDVLKMKKTKNRASYSPNKM